MKQSPQLSRVQRRMRPGIISRDGFLGRDRRPLAEVLAEDDAAVRSLGFSHEAIADRLQYLLRQAVRGLGTTVMVEDRYEVRILDARGAMPCPWGHGVLEPKTCVFLRDVQTGDELMWTPLTIHMIREHGFYDGRGSAFRIDPAAARRALRM